MKIEYTVSGNQFAEGIGWKAYKRIDQKVTSIFSILTSTIRDYSYQNFEELKDTISSVYKQKIVKSRAEFCYSENEIEIFKLGKILPQIWIVKNEDIQT